MTNSDNHNNVHITLVRKNLLDDIAVRAHTIKGRMITDHEKQRSYVADVIQDISIDRVTRAMDLAAARCTIYVGDRGTSDSSIDNAPEQKNYTFRIQSQHIQYADSLRTYLHEFVVCYALGDYLAVGYPNDSEYFMKKAEDLLPRINGFGATRRIQPYPF